MAAISPVRPYLIQYTFDNYIVTPDLRMLGIFTLIMIAVLVLETIIQFYVSYSSNMIGQSVIHDVRNKLYRHLSGFKMGYFDRTPIGTLVTRNVGDIENLASIFSEGILQIGNDILKIIVVIAVMLWIDPMLTLVCLIPIPLLIVATNVFKNGIRKTFNDVRNQVSALNSFVQEHITGMNIVKIFNREKVEYEKFTEINKKHRLAHIKSIWYYSIFFPVVEILSSISIALVVWYGATDIVKSVSADASPGKLISFILYIYMLFRPMRQLADRFNTLQMGIVCAERIFKILDEDLTIQDKGTQELHNIKGNIKFENVSFSYEKGEKVLKNISFEVIAGEMVALVGETGSGKSSIINVLNRFYEFQEGAIYIDGHDIRNIRIQSLRAHIAVVMQDVFLFSDTIANNVRLNNYDISLEQIEAAAKEVGAHEFIIKLPGGYNFNVKERGGMLSAGQRQLIAFIRAYVFNPSILILDEATSSIDSESEALIQSATEKITKGRTSIIVAHRLSTIQKADRIIVLDHGKIIEKGSHKELIEKNGHYKKLYDFQYVN